MNRKLLLLPLMLILAACSSSDDDKDGNNTGTGNTGGATTPANTDGPIVGTNVTPLCTTTTADSKGIGKACTKAGGQCAGNGEAPNCTADAPTGMPAPPLFCTKFCGKQSDCGPDANCCRVAITDKISTCAPKACGCPVPQP